MLAMGGFHYGTSTPKSWFGYPGAQATQWRNKKAHARSRERGLSWAGLGWIQSKLRLRLWSEYKIGRNSLISGDGYFLALRAIGCIPGSDCVLAWSQTVESERAIFPGHAMVRRFHDHEIFSRLRSDAAFHGENFFIGRVHCLSRIRR